MPTIEYTTTIPASLADVWAWHEDIHDAFLALVPPDQQVELIRAEPLPPRVGTIVEIKTKVPVLGWKKWIAEYVGHHPPDEHGQAWFIDKSTEGPFKHWNHKHFFQADGHETLLTDTVHYTPPLGPIGWLADKILIRRQLNAMFEYRHKVTREKFA